jgi:flagellar biosynthesis protein FlhF
MPASSANIHTFEAPTIQEALARVRATLGTQATIMETSRVAGRSWLGLGRPAKIRVVAKPAASEPAPDLDARFTELQRQINSMSVLWGTRQAAASVPSGRLERLAAAARDAGLSPDSVSALVRDLDGGAAPKDGVPPPSLRRLLHLWLTSQIPVTDLGLGTKTHSLAVVGPTGAGKTTLITRLAAAWRRETEKSLETLALMTLDTHRMGGMEPVRTLSDIWQVPCDVVYGPADFVDARKRRDHRDLILIDTPGLSPFGRGPAEMTVECLERSPADAVLLVLPVATRWQETKRLAERYLPLRPAALAVTKFDETENPALILDLCRGLGLPLAYISDDQSLSTDPRAAQSSAVADAIAEQLQPDDLHGAS